MIEVRRPPGDALVVIDGTSGAGGLPLDPDAGGRLLLRAAEELRLRRRPVAGAAEPGRARAGAADRGLRALHPGVPLAHRRARQLAQGPDGQHAGDRDALPARRAARLDARARRTRVVRGPHARILRAPVWLGGALRSRHPIRVRSAAALARGRDGRFRRVGRRRGARRHAARERDRRRRALPQARTQPAARRDVPLDRARRRARADGLHRLGAGADAARERAGAGARGRGGAGDRAAARALRGRDRVRLVGGGARGADRRVRRDPRALGDAADRRADRARRAPADHRARRGRRGQRRRRRRRRGAGSSSRTRRSRTSSPPRSTRWRCCWRSRATSRRRTPR